MIPNLAFPALSADGQDVVSGSGTVTLNKVPLCAGYGPVFRGSGRQILYATAPGVAQYDRDTTRTLVMSPRPTTVVAAGGDRDLAVLNGAELRRSGWPILKGRYFAPSVDDNGDFCWLVDGGKGQQAIWVQRGTAAPRLIVTGPFGEPRLRAGTLLFKRNEFLNGAWGGRTWGMRLDLDPAPLCVSATPNQGSAVAVQVPGRTFVLAADAQHRLLLYPLKVNPTKGYIVATGTTFYPDARLVTPTKVRVVAWRSPGLLDVYVDLTKPMVTL